MEDFLDPAAFVNRHLFVMGTAAVPAEPPEQPSVAPVPMPPAVRPVTEEDLDEYVAGLGRLSKRKRELQPALDATQAKLDDVCGKIAAAEEYMDDLRGALDRFPEDVRSLEIEDARARLTSKMQLALDAWLVTARHMRDELVDSRSRLTKYMVAMNEAAATAGSEPVAKNACPVCLTRTVELACDPCGHTFCATCSRDSASFRTACPMCRTPVSKRIRVYFSL